MLEKTKEVPQLADATYAHTLVIEKYSLYLEFFLPLWFSQTLPLK